MNYREPTQLVMTFDIVYQVSNTNYVQKNRHRSECHPSRTLKPRPATRAGPTAAPIHLRDKRGDRDARRAVFAAVDDCGACDRTRPASALPGDASPRQPSGPIWDKNRRTSDATGAVG